MANKSYSDLTRLLPEEMLSTDIISVESGLGDALESKRLTLGDLFYAGALTANVSFASNTLFIDATTHQVSINGSPSANTSDKLTVHGDAYVYGSIHATGHIVADGDLVLGDEDTDTITFNADIASNIVPDLHSTYYLGSDGKYWQALYTRDAFVKRDLDVQGDANVAGVLTVDSDFVANTDLFVDVSEHYVRASALRVGSSMVDPGANNLFVTGETTLVGAVGLSTTLGVDGNAQFSSNVNVTGNVTIQKTLDVSANTDIHSWLNVDGNVQLSSNVNVTGNTNLQGTLDVYGTTDLHSILTVDDNAEFSSNVYVVGDTLLGGDLDITGELDVASNTHLHSYLEVDGNAQFSSNVNVTGNVTIQETLDIEKTLDVNGNTNLHSELRVDGDTHLISNTSIDGILTVNNVTELNDDLHLNAHNISGFTTSSGVGYFSSDYSRLEGLRVGTTNTDPGTGNLYVEKNATIGNNLTVTGNLYVEGSTTTINSTIVAVKDADFVLRKDATIAGSGGFIVTAGSGSGQHRTFQWDHSQNRWELDENTNVQGELLVDETVNVVGNAQFSSNVNVTGNVTIQKTLDVAGDVQLDADVSIDGYFTQDGRFTKDVDVTGNVTANTFFTSTHNSNNWSEAFDAVDLVSSVSNPTFLIGTSTGYAAAEIDNSINTGVEITWHPSTGKLEFDAIPELQIVDNLGIGDNWILYDYDTQDNEGISVSANNLVAIAPHGHGRTYGVGTIPSGATHISNTALSVWGNIYSSGDVTIQNDLTVAGSISETSDVRLKSDIERIENAVLKVSQLNGYTFLKKNSEKRSSGVIAQEVEKVLPEVIIIDKDGYLSVSYANMVGLLIEAIKELQNEIIELKKIL